MTKQEKERKLKLIGLIMLVEMERSKKTKFDNPLAIISRAYEFVFWVMEYRKVQSTITFETGCIATGTGMIIGEPTEEMITIKDCVAFGVSPLKSTELQRAMRNMNILNDINSPRIKWKL